jgi:hypothetical protein
MTEPTAITTPPTISHSRKCHGSAATRTSAHGPLDSVSVLIARFSRKIHIQYALTHFSSP